MLHKFLKFLILPSCLFPYFSGEILLNSPATALPGQSTEDVGSWIQAHPTLRPQSGEKLFVQKSDTATQRFSFLASVFAPGRIVFSPDRSKIHTERINMYDGVNGVTFDRFHESLRIIYGQDIYQDYKNARIAYKYPNESAINQARLAKTPLREAIQGELRLGDRFGYWVEIAQPKTGKAVTGQMTVFLKGDLDKLEAELRNR
jgi:hypothetical protein